MLANADLPARDSEAWCGAIAEYGDSVSLMYLQPGGNGTRSRGRNETIWEHQGRASITRGYGAPAMRCQIYFANMEINLFPLPG